MPFKSAGLLASPPCGRLLTVSVERSASFGRCSAIRKVRELKVSVGLTSSRNWPSRPRNRRSMPVEVVGRFEDRDGSNCEVLWKWILEV
jgi:hypothetical protein